jgi:pimeloyl-ACP methyl ester carboxylesterase
MNSMKSIAWILAMSVTVGTTLAANAQKKDQTMEQQVSYRAIQVDGLSIFYREAGPKDAPTILLLHGLPSSSRMFQPLLTRLADNYHLVAPDYPGFGHSDWPDPKQFDYTFDRIAAVLSDFTQALGLSHYTLYMQDYGGPVGFRMALAHPDLVQALIVRMRSPTTKAWRPTGQHEEHFGQTGRLMKKRYARICCRLLLRRLDILETIRRSSFMTRIFGPMSTHF